MSSRTTVPVFALWVTLVGAALALSLFAAANDTLSGDRDVTEWLQEQPLPGQDLSDFVRALTTTEVVLAAGAILSPIMWLKGYKRHAILFGSGLAGLAILQFVMKEFVDRPRPDAELVDIRAGGSSPSFPAGHVMSGTFLYGSLTYLAVTLPLARVAAIGLVAASALLTVLVGPVNVWLGVHWPSDVLGGYLLAAVLLLPLFVMGSWRRDGR